ncbi:MULTISPECIES: GNAT family N-acetyltransferase [Kitasatospora]|uniref:GNAT family N-acetyltransferase n=1 Tax=Kitasatospora cathayae TaxID=3004092 RepID=A0ABY7QCU1_9ACTN|nr:GNAT family N-acetyltransferase [Kitasatospora sp. HUAS 3-15]WBP90570.1 GNAT family N-acetyltransferase [Kitasatospora sp. HUAS 3-15]
MSETATEPGAGPAFRVATLADVPALVELVESAYRGEASKAGWTTEAHLLDGQRTDATDVAEAVQHPEGVVLLVERDGEPIACCQLARRPDSAYFGMFSVRPTLQGGGIGRLVLAEAERMAREEWGVGRLEMNVVEQRGDLIAWYERRGFRRTGVYSPFPYGDERFGIPRRPDLRFELLTKELKQA